jgi:predicted cobalt transporter CbtA
MKGTENIPPVVPNRYNMAIFVAFILIWIVVGFVIGYFFPWR